MQHVFVMLLDSLINEWTIFLLENIFPFFNNKISQGLTEPVREEHVYEKQQDLQRILK